MLAWKYRPCWPAHILFSCKVQSKQKNRTQCHILFPQSIVGECALSAKHTQLEFRTGLPFKRRLCKAFFPPLWSLSLLISERMQKWSAQVLFSSGPSSSAGGLYACHAVHYILHMRNVSNAPLWRQFRLYNSINSTAKTYNLKTAPPHGVKCTWKYSNSQGKRLFFDKQPDRTRVNRTIEPRGVIDRSESRMIERACWENVPALKLRTESREQRWVFSNH